MNKLKQYRCLTRFDNLENLSKFKVRDIKRIDEQISFIVDEENHRQLSKIIQLESEEIRLTKLLNFLRKHLINILGLLLITLALFAQSRAIVGIKFVNLDTYSEEVIEHLEQFQKKIGPFSYLNADLNFINLDLRKTFYHYEWIGISKKGSYLYIDIKEIKNQNYENDLRPGSYYALTDGIVKRYHIEKGIVFVQEEQYVSKGEVLISGVIPQYNSEPKYIRAKGYVIGEVLQYREFEIPVQSIEVNKTGKLINTNEFYIFNKRIGKTKNNFIEFERIAETGFNFFNLFKKEKVTYYELKAIENSYNENQAIDYAKSLVEKEFRNQKTNPFEKIIFNELVKIEREDNKYHVKLIVKTYQNIAKFIPDEIIQ